MSEREEAGRRRHNQRRSDRAANRATGPVETREEARRASGASDYLQGTGAVPVVSPRDWTAEDNAAAIRRARGETNQPLRSATGESQAPFGDDFRAWYRAVTAPRPDPRMARFQNTGEESVRFAWGESSAAPGASDLRAARDEPEEQNRLEPASADIDPAPPPSLDRDWRAAVLRASASRGRPHWSAPIWGLVLGDGLSRQEGQARELRERVRGEDY